MATVKKISKDGYLFRDGEAPDAMYILKSGALQVCKQKGSGEIVLATLTPGALVGEMALFDRKPRSADVKATKESEVVVLPYDNLQTELDGLPVWLKAILKSLNENLRDANKKIRSLESGSAGDERFPPHVVTKFMSILNLISQRYGKPAEDGKGVSFSSVLLRNYTIQIFQEATNKMQAMVDVLSELGYLKQEDKGDGTSKITHLKLDELFRFVEWYNDWLFKQEKEKNPPLNALETSIFAALLGFAKKAPTDSKGLAKVNLNDVQNESMKEAGFLIRVEDISSLIEKKYLPEKIMDSNGVFVALHVDDMEPQVRNWTLINDLKQKLR